MKQKPGNDVTSHLSTPRGEIIIRTAKPADAPGLFELRIESLMAHSEAFAADIEMTKADGVEAWRDQVTRDARDQSGAIIIACADKKLIGMSGVGRGHWPKTQHGAIVWGVYVNPAWHGLHIAEAMLEACIIWSREHGIVVLRLGVVTSNEVALHCYERSGFTIIGTEPKSIYADGIYYDEYLMAKLVSDREASV